MEQQYFPAAACVQYTIRLGDPAANLAQVALHVDRYRPVAGTLLVLPEMWATGFDYQRTREFGRQTPALLAALQDIAARYQVYFAGSFTEGADDTSLPFNTLFLVGPDGVLGRLPKQHLFSYWQEDQHYQPGQDHPPIQSPFGPLAGAVCYDLRFPEQIRRQIFLGCSLLVISAQWPQARLDNWQTLVRARAIENQCYVIAANSCGITGTMELAGHSMIVAPDGRIMQEGGSGAMVISCCLEPNLVDEQRSRFHPAGQRPWLQKNADKIRTVDDLLVELGMIRHHQSRVAFTNGCFDILHAGHVSYLEHARRTADCLVVGLNSDTSVRALKGAGRPVNGENDRARVLAALGCVDYVVLFDQETPQQLIATLVPDVLVKGADWPEDQIVGAAEVKAAGGQVVRIPFEHDRSTTALINAIRKQ